MRRNGVRGNKRKMFRKALIRRDGNACCYCRREFTDDLPPTFEHKIPRALGGSNALRNLALACFPCNNERGDSPEWPTCDAVTNR